MTDKTDIELMQQALNDLEALVAYIKGSEPDLFMQVPSIEALSERLAQPKQESVLQDIEQYRMQMASISTAAIGYWKEGDGIHPDYDTPALRDVAMLYAKYDALYKAQPAQGRREWQGLTYAEMWTLVDEHLKYQLESYEVRVFNLIRAVEAKLKEKND